jgi:hypothetical protein
LNGCIPLAGADLVRAVTGRELLAAQRFVHDCLVEEGLLEARRGGLRLRPQDAMPESALFAAVRQGRILAVASVSIDAEAMGLPCAGPFALELDQLRESGRHICEIAVHSSPASPSAKLICQELDRLCLAHGALLGCDTALRVVEPWREPHLSGRGFRTFGPTRTFGSDAPFPARLMLKRVGGDHPHPPAGLIRRWMAAAEASFKELGLLRWLIHEGGVLADCTPAQRAFIRRRWGPSLYDKATAPVETHGPSSTAAASGEMDAASDRPHSAEPGTIAAGPALPARAPHACMVPNGDTTATTSPDQRIITGRTPRHRRSLPTGTGSRQLASRECLNQRSARPPLTAATDHNPPISRGRSPQANPLSLQFPGPRKANCTVSAEGNPEQGELP